MNPAWIYKIVPRSAWLDALACGTYVGSEHDQRDGFIHFSGAHQVEATAVKHYSGQLDLLIVAFDPQVLGPNLHYEISRDNQHFPHLYAPLNPTAACAVGRLTWNGPSVTIEWNAGPAVGF